MGKMKFGEKAKNPKATFLRLMKDVFENRYGLDLCLSKAIISFLPLVYPPLAPPSAFPNVPVIISTLPITFLYS